jgi:hypothetical protein
VQGRQQRADPAAHAQRCKERRKGRAVILYDEDDGIAAIKSEQPVEIAKMMYAKIDRLARKEPKDGRSMDKAEVTIAEDGTATITTRWGQTYTTKPEPVEEPPF